jgi:hypothetical protein
LDLSFFWLFHLGSVPPPTLPPALSHTPLIEKKSNSVSHNQKNKNKNKNKKMLAGAQYPTGMS